jgi:hypothetical protein
LAADLSSVQPCPSPPRRQLPEINDDLNSFSDGHGAVAADAGDEYQ